MVRTRAFTLLEVIVTLVLLGIVGATAVAGTTAFLDRTRDTEARAALDNVVLLQQSFANGFGTYASEPADLKVGRDLEVVPGGDLSDSGSTISMSVSDQGSLGLAVLSDSGTCLLRSVTALDAGAETITRPVTGEPCTGQAALPDGEAPIVPVSLR